jgi:hypothetical protein
MSMTAELEAAERRLARMVNRRADEEEAQLRQDAAERRALEAAKAREDAERRREYQVLYADAFASHGSLVPAPIDDEPVGRYRKRLFDSLQNKLPPSHDLAQIRSDDLTSSIARTNFEQMLLQAAVAEGATPSRDNLPRDGSMVSRVRVDDDSGQRRTEFYGRESFIKQLSRPGRKVGAFVTNRGTVLCQPQSA